MRVHGNLEKLDSTTTLLGINGVYTTSKALDLSIYDIIAGSVFSDQVGTLLIQQSWDATNWDVQTSIAVSTSAGKDFTVNIVAPYGRLMYTNGSIAQTVFRLYAGGKAL